MKAVLVTLALVGALVAPAQIPHAPQVDIDPAETPPYPATPERLAAEGLDTEYHLCISVADGDTITLEKLGKIRFVGVDTPEKNHPMLPVQYMAREASEFTKKMCLGKKIRLEYDGHDENFRGNYGRVLGYVYLEDGTFMQEELIRRGYSIAYIKYPLNADRKAQFLAWEAEAREKGVGLWREGGMDEVRWIKEQGYPEFTVFGMAHKKWGLQYENYVLPRIASDELEIEVGKLNTWIYELAPRDLDETLQANGYRVLQQSEEE